MKLFSLSLALFLTPFNTHAFDLGAKPCSFESLCQKYQKGYQNAEGERLRAHFPKAFNRKVFETPKMKARIAAVFNEAKALLINVIQNEGLLSSEVRNEMIARVKPVGIAPQADRAGSSGYVAVFWADTYEVLTEYSVGEMPKANLINLFGHELSHSFDGTAAMYTIVNDGGQVYQNDEVQNPSNGKRTILSNAFDWSAMAPVTTILSGYGVKENQMDESASDYFARKVSEAYLATLPAEKQKAAALEGQMDLIVQGCSNWKYVLNDTNNYPTLRVRVESIYFGSSTISKLAGCSL